MKEWWRTIVMVVIGAGLLIMEPVFGIPGIYLAKSEMNAGYLILGLGIVVGIITFFQGRKKKSDNE